MKKSSIFLRGGCAVLLICFWGGTLILWSQVNPIGSDLQRHRTMFIKNFQRTILNTTPGDAKFLQIMVESSGAKRGVEIGSATGYGAIHMGMAFERNGGHLYTIDIDPAMVKVCRKNLQEMALEKTVTCLEGDALEVIPQLQGMYDFVFIDAHKSDYLKYFKAIEPKLQRNAVIAADNVIVYADAMRDFLDAVAADPKYEMVILKASEEKKDGMALIYKRE